MTEGHIGTNDTSGVHGCPCGRSHPDPRPYRLRIRRGGDHSRMAAMAYEAYYQGKASPGEFPGEHVLHFAKDCEKPLTIRKAASAGALHLTYQVRCRRCKVCLRAKQNYWALAAVEQMRIAAEQGRRTWFGTLTLRPGQQDTLRAQAWEKWACSRAEASVECPDWWNDPKCDYAFSFVRDEMLAEVQKFWKRLRKRGHRFKYFLVFERHKSGMPHAHFLLHEMDAPILKRHLQSQWELGFTNVKLVRPGTDGKCRSPYQVAFYVAKYLSKTVQARQIASRLYRPSRSRM